MEGHSDFPAGSARGSRSGYTSREGGRDRFPEQLVALCGSAAVPERTGCHGGEPLSVHQMSAAETLRFAASAFLSAQNTRELLVWGFLGF